MRALAIALALLVGTPALAAEKLGLGVGSGAAGVKDDLLEVMGEHGQAVEIPKAPPKGGKRKKWAKDAQGEEGLTAIVTAEVAGKRLKLGLWINGKPVSATGANLKGKGLDGSAKSAISSWLKAQVGGGGGGAVAAAPSGKGDDDDDDDDAPVVVPPPPPAKGRGAVAAASKDDGRAAPVVAAPPPPPARSSGEGASGRGEDRALARSDKAEGSGDRAIAGGAKGNTGDFGGGFLGSALGVARGLPPLIVLHAEFQSVGRGFSYSDPITTNLRPYSVAFMPTPGVALEAYPLTLTGISAVSGLGFSFAFHTSLGVKSARAQPATEFPTTYSSIEFGALYRIMLGDGYTGGALIPSIGWSSTAFDLDPVNGAREEQLPNVSYPGLRLGLGFDVPLVSALRLQGDGAFVIVGTPGEIISSTFFRSGSVNGLVARIGFSVGFLDHVAAEVGVTYQHFFYDFDPEVGDAFIAGGALDQFVVGRAGVRVEL